MKKLFTFSIIFLFFLSLKTFSFAATNSIVVGCGSGADAVWTLTCIFPLISSIIFWLLVFAGIIAVIIIIISGLRLIMSGGDPKAIDQARKTLAWAIIGLVIVFLSFFIINIISVVTGVKCIDPSHPLSFTSCQ